MAAKFRFVHNYKYERLPIATIDKGNPASIDEGHPASIDRPS